MEWCDELSKRINGHIAKRQYPWFAASIVHAGHLVWGGAFVGTERELPPPSMDTLFYVASISKIFTGMAVVVLHQEGRLDLDVDINTYLLPTCGQGVRNPNFPDVPITPRMLLTHTSGLNDDEEGLVNWRRDDGDHPCTLPEYVSTHLTKVRWSDTPPGDASYWYSNAGFTVLGCLVQVVAQEPFERFVKTRLFEPLGMSTACWLTADLPPSGAAVPTDKNGPIGLYGVAEYPAAQMKVSIRELSLLLQFLTGTMGLGVPLPNKETVQLMCPEDFCNGLAWWGRDSWYGKKQGGSWSHGGFMPGVRAMIDWRPAQRSGLLLVANGEGEYGQLEGWLLDALNIHASSS